VTELDPVTVRVLSSDPTLEPSLTAGNEHAVTAALEALGVDRPAQMTAAWVDGYFSGTGRRRKAEFALALADEIDRRRDAGKPVTVPAHIAAVFDHLYADGGTDDSTINDGGDDDATSLAPDA